LRHSLFIVIPIGDHIAVFALGVFVFGVVVASIGVSFGIIVLSPKLSVIGFQFISKSAIHAALVIGVE